jgi:hypothetical protein
MRSRMFMSLIVSFSELPVGTSGTVGNLRGLGGGGCREATADEAAEYLSWSPHWAHLMRLTLELGWHDVHRTLGKL